MPGPKPAPKAYAALLRWTCVALLPMVAPMQACAGDTKTKPVAKPAQSAGAASGSLSPEKVDGHLSFAGWREGVPMLRIEAHDNERSSGDDEGSDAGTQDGGSSTAAPRYVSLQDGGSLKSYLWKKADSLPDWPEGMPWNAETQTVGEASKEVLAVQVDIRLDSVKWSALEKAVAETRESMESGEGDMAHAQAKMKPVPAQLSVQFQDVTQKLKASWKGSVQMKAFAGETGFEAEPPRLKSVWLSPNGNEALLAWQVNGAARFAAVSLNRLPTNPAD